MSMELFVFYGPEEIIVAPKDGFNKVYQSHFIDGDRDIEDYEVFMIDGSEGLSITTRMETELWHAKNSRFVEIHEDGTPHVYEMQQVKVI